MYTYGDVPKVYGGCGVFDVTCLYQDVVLTCAALCLCTDMLAYHINFVINVCVVCVCAGCIVRCIWYIVYCVIEVWKCAV